MALITVYITLSYSLTVNQFHFNTFMYVVMCTHHYKFHNCSNNLLHQQSLLLSAYLILDFPKIHAHSNNMYVTAATVTHRYIGKLSTALVVAVQRASQL